MRAILVDDEPLALKDLERQLQKIGGVEIVGTFQHAAPALEEVSSLRPDVVFLDIDMPEMNGLEAADHLQQLNPAVQAVFVTAYEHFAVQAFELQALDYILKPIRTDRLSQTVQRLERSLADDAWSGRSAEPVAVRCFRRMQIEYGANEPFAWRTTKGQELFAYLLFNKDHLVRKDQLIDVLWPDSDYKKAYTQLYTTIYQLRRSLESARIPIRIGNSGNCYSLDMGGIASDVEQWESLLKDGADPARLPLADYRNWLETYRGDYLEEHDYVWAERERQRLRNLWHQHALLFGERLEESDWRAAAAWYQEVQLRMPEREETYFALMKLYARANERTLVTQQYEQLQGMTREEYEAEPNAAIRSWYEEWLRG